jgi:hypothetical protein
MTNEVTHDYVDQLRGKFGKRIYKKKPIEIEAYQIDNPFYVETLEGTMKGKAGDYIIIGVRNELYICDSGIFNETYDYVGMNEY